MVKHPIQVYQASERRACRLLKLHRTSCRIQPKKDPQPFLRMRIKEIAATQIRYGYRRIHILLKSEGWQINHKRVYRLYMEEGLNLRGKRKREKISAPRIVDKNAPSRLNECWAMDFVSDQLYNGKRFRVFTLIDTYSRECLATFVEKSIKGEQVADVLNGVKKLSGLPAKIKVDNGPEFISRALDAWAYLNKVRSILGQANRPTTHILNHSTAVCGMSASMFTGSCH